MAKVFKVNIKKDLMMAHTYFIFQSCLVWQTRLCDVTSVSFHNCLLEEGDRWVGYTIYPNVFRQWNNFVVIARPTFLDCLHSFHEEFKVNLFWGLTPHPSTNPPWTPQNSVFAINFIDLILTLRLCLTDWRDITIINVTLIYLNCKC